MDPEFIRDLFAQFRPVTMKRMFGGAGLYADGLCSRSCSTARSF